MDKNEIVEILIKRDGITMEEAVRIVKDTQQAIDELLDAEVASLCMAEDIIADFLGLEPDYLDAFLY